MAERLNKRNLAYNNRHRLWGIELTAMDVDFMEYDSKTGKPLALIETKYGRITEVDLNEPAFDALCSLAREEIPVFCLVYYPLDKDGKLVEADQPNADVAHIQFYGVGVNAMGRKYLPKAKRMLEIEWVNLLRELHHSPDESLVGLCKTWVPVNVPQITFRPVERN